MCKKPYKGFTDLSEEYKVGNLTHSVYMKSVWERAELGVSHFDMEDFAVFFDEMLLNVFTILDRRNDKSNPREMPYKEWDIQVEEMLEILGDIQENHRILFSDKPNKYDSYTDYSQQRAKLFEENKRLRKKVLAFIGEYIDDMFIYD